MDIEENYEPQQQQQQQQQHLVVSPLQQALLPTQQPQQQQQQHIAEQQQQQMEQQQQQMQCDPIFTTTTMTTTTAVINSMANANAGNPLMVATSNIAIPLTGPPVAALLPVSASQVQAPISNVNASMTMTQQVVKSSSTLPTNDYDIDSLLLQQFSCMGTTDHEDLISQFQSLMNNQMNRDSARFYLEMSNWNLQAALGCYLDFCSLQSIPSMKIVDRSEISAIQQSFRLQNDGTERWPNGCFLTSPTQKQNLSVPSLRPGETCDIMADIMPAQPPIMWRLCTPNGWYFGETIWMIPPGTQASQDELQQRMLQLITSEVTPEGYPQMNIVMSDRH